MERRIVLPGEKVADGKIRIPNTYIEGDATYAAVIGTIDAEGRFVPLENRYRPVVGDTVVGLVADIRRAGYIVDINLPEAGLIVSRDVKIKLQLGDFVMCRVKLVNEVGDTELGEVRRLPLGKIIKFPPAKIPRLIGKSSSMLNLLKEHGEGDIMVGNNGYVWISEKSNMPLLLKTISEIDAKAHTSGLTNYIAELLKTEAKV